MQEGKKENVKCTRKKKDIFFLMASESIKVIGGQSNEKQLTLTNIFLMFFLEQG